jgi:cardiolipin synthase
MFEYLPEKLHTKLLIIDDVVHLGSANFDFRSLYLNLEMMLRIEDPALPHRCTATFERQLAQAQEITPPNTDGGRAGGAGSSGRRPTSWSRQWTIR